MFLTSSRRTTVVTTQPLIIYYKDQNSHSNCWDNEKNKWLDINDIDDSYCLDISESEERVEVMIPRGVKCSLRKGSSEENVTIEYKNIQCNLTFENGDMEYFFEIVEE